MRQTKAKDFHDFASEMLYFSKVMTKNRTAKRFGENVNNVFRIIKE